MILVETKKKVKWEKRTLKDQDRSPHLTVQGTLVSLSDHPPCRRGRSLPASQPHGPEGASLCVSLRKSSESQKQNSTGPSVLRACSLRRLLVTPQCSLQGDGQAGGREGARQRTRVCREEASERRESQLLTQPISRSLCLC